MTPLVLDGGAHGTVADTIYGAWGPFKALPVAPHQDFPNSA
jgi:hypothetical protein